MTNILQDILSSFNGYRLGTETTNGYTHTIPYEDHEDRKTTSQLSNSVRNDISYT